MKRCVCIFLLVVTLFCTFQALAIASEETDDTWEISWTPDLRREIPELGDTSSSIVELSVVAGLLLAGAAFAHYKSKKA